MVAPIDIWRTANVILKQFGDAAPEFAAKRISDLTMKGDKAGASVWSDVLAALAVLRMQEAPDSLPRH
jgi:hypothetical protein